MEKKFLLENMNKAKDRIVSVSSNLGESLAETTKQIKESKNFEKTKEGVIVAKEGIVKTAGSIVKTGKEAQTTVIAYIDKKKNAKFLSTKLQSFEDGFKEGKIQAVDYIKKYANFCLAATAVSYFFARADGEINDAEMLEIQYDLDSIMKNKDLPDELKNKLSEISNDENLSFEEVKTYLDGVGIETLLEFQRDIEEIIFADNIVTESERNAKEMFDEYLDKRKEDM